MILLNKCLLARIHWSRHLQSIHVGTIICNQVRKFLGIKSNHVEKNICKNPPKQHVTGFRMHGRCTFAAPADSPAASFSQAASTFGRKPAAVPLES